jgi:hypothetical protein
MVAPVFERNDIAIGWFAENFQYFTAEYPVVAVQDSRSRFNDNSSHAGANVERPMPPVQLGMNTSILEVES